MGTGSVSFRHLILGLLTQQPMSGYDVKHHLKGLSWLIGTPSPGSLYPALHALLEDDLVTVSVVFRENRPPRKIYAVTEAGKRVLQQWIDQPVTPSAPLKAFTMRLLLASNFSDAGLVAHLRQRREQVAAHQTALGREVEEMGGGRDLGGRLVVKYGLALASAELDWLDGTLDQLPEDRLPAQAAGG